MLAQCVPCDAEQQALCLTNCAAAKLQLAVPKEALELCERALAVSDLFHQL